MKRPIACLLALCLLLSPLAGLAASAAWIMVPAVFRPGETQTLMYSVPEGTIGTAVAVDAAGNDVLTVRQGLTGGSFQWDGTGLLPGTYTLQLRAGLLAAETSITVEEGAPVIDLITGDAESKDAWQAELWVSRRGTLTGTLADGTVAFTQAVEAGNVAVSWDLTADGSRLSDGTWELILSLQSEGERSGLLSTDVTIVSPSKMADVTYFTPAEMTGVTCPHGEGCYWCLTMGKLDEEAIWKVLTSPMTVLDGDERHQVKVRKEPSKTCKTYTGEVTCLSQGVHILERGEEWTLIQAYSSSTEGSKVAVFAKPFTGYVETSLLKEREVSQHIGLVIDKLQQRLYVFQDGKLLGSLICSTGYSKKDTPYNETPAGEFLCQSWVGGFWATNLYCDMGIRINDGILLHEVPCIISEASDGSKNYDYSRCEGYLGEKASHGCIRIQKKSSPEGLNMKWLWDNLSRGHHEDGPSKVVIWDEVGRELTYPDDDLTLWYNPNNGKSYHSSAHCSGIKEAYLSQLRSFTYGELDEKPYSKLERCTWCWPEPRRSEVDTMNKKNTRSY